MIIQNGYIQVKVKTAGGIDPTTGFPIKATGTTYESPIPCQYIPNVYNQLGRTSSGEPFTIAKYIIFIEQSKTPFTAEQVRLTDMDSAIVGEYAIISAEVLQAVGEVKLLV